MGGGGGGKGGVDWLDAGMGERSGVGAGAGECIVFLWKVGRYRQGGRGRGRSRSGGLALRKGKVGDAHLGAWARR